MSEPIAFVDEFFTESSELPSGLHRTHRVDVVLVTHDGARWLPRTLAAIRGSRVQPDAVHVIDTESIDSTLEHVRNAGELITTLQSAPRTQAYGASVAQAVSMLPEADAELAWIWLLHDDSAPAADGLETLLRAAEAHPDAAILGMKSVGWNDSSRLFDLGLTMTGAGHRDPRVERGERDPATGLITLTFVVEEGPRVYVERINVRGNTRTRDYVIRREFPLGEGDAYNRVLVDKAEKRLNDKSQKPVIMGSLGGVPRSGMQADQKFLDLVATPDTWQPVFSRQSDLADSIMTAIVLAPFATAPTRFTELGRLRVDWGAMFSGTEDDLVTVELFDRQSWTATIAKSSDYGFLRIDRPRAASRAQNLPPPPSPVWPRVLWRWLHP